MDRGAKTLDPDDLDILSEIMEIPAELYYRLLPPSDVLVADFIKFKLPDVDGAGFTQTPDSSFDRAPPKETLRIPTLIPPKAWVYGLRSAVNTAIRDGKRSIVHPHLRHQPLPLWMLALWEKAHVVREVQISWIQAHDWLEAKMVENPKLSSPECYHNLLAARDAMLLLPHRKTIYGRFSKGRKNTSQLTRIFSDNSFLSDTLIDLMVQATNCRKPSNKRIIIVDTELSDSIRLDKINFDMGPSSLEHMLTTGKDLYFPVCIPEMSHFVAFNVDFAYKTISYGKKFS
jgi:hypothetical protein